jgi:hypothetical protein
VHENKEFKANTSKNGTVQCGNHDLYIYIIRKFFRDRVETRVIISVDNTHLSPDVVSKHPSVDSGKWPKVVALSFQ